MDDIVREHRAELEIDRPCKLYFIRVLGAAHSLEKRMESLISTELIIDVGLPHTLGRIGIVVMLYFTASRAIEDI